MKLNRTLKMTAVCRALLIAAFALMSGGALKAQGNFFDNSVTAGSQTITLGTAGGGTGYQNWAIFALSGGVTITDPTSGGGYDVLGNVGMAGSGYLNMSVAWVSGGVYNPTGTGNLFSGGSYASGGAGAMGGTYFPTAVTNAQNASGAATAAGAGGSITGTGINALTYGGAFTGTPGTIALSGTSASITGQANQTYVLNLTNLALASSTLTLVGTASTNFVFNIAQYMVLSNAAHIVLSGGLQPQNVLFNVQSNTPQYDVTLSGASTANGIILAPTRNVKMTGASAVTGEVIANAVSLAGASKVINPTVSP
jgi:hypothetical protein